MELRIVNPLYIQLGLHHYPGESNALISGGHRPFITYSIPTKKNSSDKEARLNILEEILQINA